MQMSTPVLEFGSPCRPGRLAAVESLNDYNALSCAKQLPFLGSRYLNDETARILHKSEQNYTMQRLSLFSKFGLAFLLIFFVQNPCPFSANPLPKNKICCKIILFALRQFIRNFGS